MATPRSSPGRLPILLRAIFLMACGLLLPSAGGQVLTGDVAAVGFRSSGDEQFAVRLGQWFPVQLQLNVQGSDIFTGVARLEGRDLDGDIVNWTTAPFNLTPSVPNQRVWLYAVINEQSEAGSAVEILGRGGARVTELPLPAFAVAPPHALWILDISAVKVTRLAGLVERQIDATATRHYRPIRLSLGSVEELPDRWLGLEAIDAIVWDRPDPQRLRPHQLDALIEWVRRGGQLVLGVGDQWNALRASKLAPLLPLAGDGPPANVTRLDSLARLVPRAADAPGRREVVFRAPISVCTARLAEDAVATWRDVGPGGALNLIAMRPVGSGRVVCCAAALNDLSGGPISSEALFQQLLEINRHTDKYLERSGTLYFGPLSEGSGLFDDLIRPIKFSEQTVIRGLAALFFVAVYLLVGAFGSWWYLQRRQRAHLSWPIFAAVAVVASFLSLATVAGLRGLSRGVGASGLLDLDAGSPSAGGYCLFGYRSPIRQAVDLQLEGTGGFLRALMRGSNFMDAYITPLRYSGEPTAGRLVDVPMRATLKQFEGYWTGELDGTIRADLAVVQQTGQLTPESWIINDLATPIDGGYLLYVDPRHVRNAEWQNRPVPRATGVERSWNQNDTRGLPPANQVICLPLARLDKAGGRAAHPGAGVYEKLDRDLQTWRSQRERLAASRPDLPTLWSEQQAWAGNRTLAEMAYAALTLTDPPRELNALLLASTATLFVSTAGANPDEPARPVSLRGIPRADICHWLFGGVNAGGEAQSWGVLLLWLQRPPPARLLVDGAPLRSQGGWTLLRVRVPLRLVNGPTPPGDFLGDPPAAAP